MLVLIIAEATDLAASSVASLAARLAVLSPAIGAFALLISNAQARMRGESQALATIGVSPLRASVGSLLAAITIGLLGCAFVLVFAPPLSPLFPQLNMPTWSLVSIGTWRNCDGLLVAPQTLAFLSPTPSHHPDTDNRLPVSALIALLALSIPAWLSYRVSYGIRLLVAGAATVGLLLGFHLVAANMLSAWGLVTAPMLIAFHLIILEIQSRRANLQR